MTSGIEALKHLWEAAEFTAEDLDIENARANSVSLKVIAAVAAASALPDLIARVERAEKERDRLRKAIEEPAMWTLQSALTGDTPNV